MHLSEKKFFKNICSNSPSAKCIRFCLNKRVIVASAINRATPKFNFFSIYQRAKIVAAFPAAFLFRQSPQIRLNRCKQDGG